MSSSDAELPNYVQRLATFQASPDAEWTEVSWNGENYRIFPQAGLAMLNSSGQYLTRPRYYPIRLDGGIGRVVRRRYSRTQFEQEDWTKLSSLYVYDNSVLVARFTHHQYELSMCTEIYYLM